MRGTPRFVTIRGMSRHPSILLRRLSLGFIGLNAGFVAAFGLLSPKAFDEAFTWAVLPPLHARFVGALYLWGTIVLAVAAVTRRRSVWWPIAVGAAIFTTSMLVLTVWNSNAFDWSKTPVKVWVIAYILFPIMTIPFAWRFRHADPDDRDEPLPIGLAVMLRVVAVALALVGIALLVARRPMAERWPWPVSNGVAQFYGGPFITIAWCAWAFSRRPRRDIRGFAVALGVLGAVVIAISMLHRSLFNTGRLSTWVWFVGSVALVIVGTLTASVRRHSGLAESVSHSDTTIGRVESPV